jgi:CheY-like chemotaxis protein
MSSVEKTVLVVDDEPTVLGTVRDGLTAYGYRVLEALDGETALAVAESHQGRSRCCWWTWSCPV